MTNQEVKTSAAVLIEYLKSDSQYKFRINPLLQGYGSMINEESSSGADIKLINLLINKCRRGEINKQDYYMGIALDEYGIFSAYDLTSEEQISHIATSPRVIDFSLVGNKYRLVTGRNFIDVVSSLKRLDDLNCHRDGIRIEGEIANALSALNF